MKKTILFITLACTMCTTNALRIEDEGVFITKDDIFGVVGTGLCGGVTYGILKYLEPPNSNATTAQLAISGMAGIAGGTISYLLSKQLAVSSLENCEQYTYAFNALEIVLASPLMTTPYEYLLGFVATHYGTEEPFNKALAKFDKLILKLENAYIGLEKVIKNTQHQRGAKARKLYNNSKKLHRNIQEHYKELQRRRTLVEGESKYEVMKNELLRARGELEEVLASGYVQRDFDSFLEYIDTLLCQAPYILCFNALKALLDSIDSIYEKLTMLVRETKMKSDTRYAMLREEVLRLLQECATVRDDLLKKRTLVLRELDYDNAKMIFDDLSKETNMLLTSDLVAHVNESYDKTVAYGISVVDDLWPLLGIVITLRTAMKKVREIQEKCRSYKDAYLDRLGEQRYKALVENYDMLLERIESEFLFELFEQRTQEIFLSDEYKEEVRFIEKKKRHEESMRVLREMQTGLEGAVNRVKRMVADVNRNVDGLKRDVSDMKRKVSNVESSVSGVRKKVNSLSSDVGSLKSSLSTVKSDVSRVKSDVSSLNRK